MTVLSVCLSAVGPGMGVAVYAGLVGALLLCVILVLCVGVLAYRRRCRHLHGDITDSSSALTAAFHPGNYKPPRQGEFLMNNYTHTSSHMHHLIHMYTHVLIFTTFLFLLISMKHFITFYFFIMLLFKTAHKLNLLVHYLHSLSQFSFFTALYFKHLSCCCFSCSFQQILINNINPFHSCHFFALSSLLVTVGDKRTAPLFSCVHR